MVGRNSGRGAVRRGLTGRALIAGDLLVLACMVSPAPAQVQWQSGTSDLSGQSRAEVIEALATAGLRGGDRHVVVQFSEPVTPATRTVMADAGVELLGSLGNHAHFAAVDAGGADADALGRASTLIDARSVQRDWKLHPDLIDDIVHDWAIVQADDQSADPADPVVGVYVIFHRDVDPRTEGFDVLEVHDAHVRSSVLAINGLVVELPASQVKLLAEEDAVQWIEPPLPRLSAINADNRERTGADEAQSIPYNLSGQGVDVLVYDAGTVRTTHVDFEDRASVFDTSGMHNHPTHVAGTVGGAGIQEFNNRGMAPGVTIISYGFEQEGGLHEGFLYFDPGDIEADYSEAISQHGAVISNNSIGTNTAGNRFPCEWEGNYGVTGALIDTIVRGDGSNPLFTAPFRVVWANGNERGSGRCGSQYHTTAPPACAKNHITVGALVAEDDSMSSFSSWGPSDDDRLKPDISAPGVNVLSCSSSSDTAYETWSGTSMASPTVCGLAALLIEDYRAFYPDLPEMRNSTLKVLFAHTAVDLGNTGPDYQFGYGSVRVVPAIELVRAGNFLEDSISQGEVYSVLVLVNEGEEFKVTLAWDDVPGTPNVMPVLVNDLDLRVIDPSSQVHYPWTLGGLADPSAAAVRDSEDHVNNIEQVVIDAPAPGVYLVEIAGYSVPEGPQPFSIAASPQLVACSSAGRVSFNAAPFRCEATAQIRVNDCDLNTDSETVQTVEVSVWSDSEPGGETVLLTETAPETADFRGTIDISTTDGSGVLHVADGDMVTVLYIDADDGEGGTDVDVTDEAFVDCVPPVISNVDTTDIEPRSARVAFETDELAEGSVRYGESCDALTETARVPGFATEHSVPLTGLQDDHTYFYAVDAVDEAGNAASDDAGGACYMFATPDVPDFFTEQFTGTFDLDGLSVTFVPNGSVDYYVGCVEEIEALPTDPASGTQISLSDDDSEEIDLGLAQVRLYGVSYNALFIGANGYLTFGERNGDYRETLADHFSVPRVSAVFDDLNPSTGGRVSWEPLLDRIVVSYENVPEIHTDNSNTFQIEMFLDGKIRVSYLGIDSSDNIAGLSEGAGLDPDYYPSDLSALGSCPPRPPRAQSVDLATPVHVPVEIELSATDDGLPEPPSLALIVTSLPGHGSLTDLGAGAIASVPYTLADGGTMVQYAPNPCYSGEDSFEFKANDGGAPPEGGDSNTATVTINTTVADRHQVIYSYPMDEDPGWTTEAEWAFGAPTGGGGHAGDPTGGYTGDNVLGYNLDGDYTNNMDVYYATTDAIDCSELTGVELRFRRWLGVERSSYDHATVEASTDGLSWDVVWEHSGERINESSWSEQIYDLSATADGESTVYIRWSMGPTDRSVTYPGWNIDDVEIWGEPQLEPMRADLNADGLVNLFDFSIYGACLSGPSAVHASDCECADIDFDGDVDLVDFSVMQDEME